MRRWRNTNRRRCTCTQEMAGGLASRMLGLRAERIGQLRAPGFGRESIFLRALALDPSLADAHMGLGLYNYYVDTLFDDCAGVLRFFMGIPGGSKEDGIRQLQTGDRSRGG